MIDSSQRVAARVAGLSCLISIAIVIFANYALLNALIVPRDAIATARNITAHQTQLRIVLTCFLTYSTCVIVLLTALYIVLKPVSSGLALLAAVLRLVFASLWLLTALNLLSALRILGNAPYLQAFGTDRLQVLSRLLVAANFDNYYVGLPFFSLASTVCSYLWLKSGYVPRALATLGLITSAWCVVCAFIYLVSPDFGKPVDPYWFDSPMEIFEVVLSLWLLIKGIRAPVIGAT